MYMIPKTLKFLTVLRPHLLSKDYHMIYIDTT